jgi:hypothetical protein
MKKPTDHVILSEAKDLLFVFNKKQQMLLPHAGSA